MYSRAVFSECIKINEGNQNHRKTKNREKTGRNNTNKKREKKTIESCFQGEKKQICVRFEMLLRFVSNKKKQYPVQNCFRSTYAISSILFYIIIHINGVVIFSFSAILFLLLFLFHFKLFISGEMLRHFLTLRYTQSPAIIHILSPSVYGAKRIQFKLCIFFLSLSSDFFFLSFPMR